MKYSTRLYPIAKELEESAKYLSTLPEAVYRLFEKQGIPPTVVRRVKREVNSKK